MIIVSDTTPIISLIKAEYLELLEQLFQEGHRAGCRGKRSHCPG